VTTPEEKYYDSMNTLLAPVRWAKSLVQTFLIILLLIGIGLFYPIIQLCNGDPFSIATLLVPMFTILFLFTLFYAPYYTIIGGFISFIVFDLICLGSFVSSMSKTELVSLPFAFLTIGILQRYVRHRLFDSPKPSRHRTAAEWLRLSKEADKEKRGQLYNNMSLLARAKMTRLFGSNYLEWPESAFWPE
jgi:hypothetical protein